jgi:hypothetical protein
MKYIWEPEDIEAGRCVVTDQNTKFMIVRDFRNVGATLSLYCVVNLTTGLNMAFI